MRGRQSPGSVTGGGGKPDAASGGAIQGAGARVHEAQRPAAAIPRSAGGTGCGAPAAELLHEEGDLDALKRLALKGEKPDDSVAIRHGLAEGYRRLEELSREWSEEMRGDNHTVMEQIELRERTSGES